MRPLNPRRFAPLLLCAPLALAGCGDSLARSFGLQRTSPNEFLVTTRAPLSMPPNYMLQPPQPGAARPMEQSASRSAESALVPQQALAAPAGTSRGQQALVEAAGPPAPAGIRASVNAQAAADHPSSGLTDKLLFWKLPAQPGITVDPKKEAERLREDAALGKNSADGTTPIILPKSKTIFGF